RAEIAFARAQAGLVYASIDNNKGEVWRSTDAGATWQLLSNPQHLNDQGDYDNAVWVDPTDAAHVVVAGLDIYQSRDGAATFAKLSDWRLAPGGSAHADHHALVAPPGFGPANPVLYDATDGGIYRTSNIYATTTGGWVNMNNGLADGYPNDGASTYCGADATKSANFIAPFILDSNNANRLLAGGASLWATDSARGTVTWRTLKSPAGATGNYISAIAVAEGNS